MSTGQSIAGDTAKGTPLHSTFDVHDLWCNAQFNASDLLISYQIEPADGTFVSHQFFSRAINAVVTKLCLFGIIFRQFYSTAFEVDWRPVRQSLEKGPKGILKYTARNLCQHLNLQGFGFHADGRRQRQ
jgi:hypothetical protein